MQYCKHLTQEGRRPTKEQSPWNMQGWLLMRVQEAEMAQWGEASRWLYYFKMKSYLEPSFAKESGFFAGDAGPIPQRDFTALNDDAYHHLKQCLEAFAGRSYGWSDLRDFVEYLLWSASLSENCPRVSEKGKQALFEKLEPSVIVAWPYDYLGRLILEHRGKSAWNPNAFYPTPAVVVKAMTEIAFHDQHQADKEQGKDTRFTTVLDPCCGTGAMLLEASNHSLYLSGQDIDPLLVGICKLNGLFFVPWMAFGLADMNT